MTHFDVSSCLSKILQNTGSGFLFPIFQISNPKALGKIEDKNRGAVPKETNRDYLLAIRHALRRRRTSSRHRQRMLSRARLRALNPHCMSSAALLLVEQFSQYLESGECHTLVAVLRVCVIFCARRLSVRGQLATVAPRSRSGTARSGTMLCPCAAGRFSLSFARAVGFCEISKRDSFGTVGAAASHQRHQSASAQQVTSYCFVPHSHTLIISRLLLLAGCGGNVDESSVAAAASLFSSSV